MTQKDEIMARPRSFDSDQVIEAAKGVFWHKGYQGAAVDDLERATGLNRSSLYGAFGSKKALFDRALESFNEDFIDFRIAPMERPEATVEDAVGFFVTLVEFFRNDEHARLGCLMVNSIAEFEGRDVGDCGQTAAYRDRLRGGFRNALREVGDPATVEQRARMLVATALGCWLSARMDPADAAAACDATIAQIRTWA